ncbi:MAG: hypothetical protein U9N54_09520 [candidate division Zixibacteria bacterium]|nr:hypothetical protein [candidate division Zixibacteria bacterium]
MISSRHLLKICILQILLLVCLVISTNAIELKQSFFDKKLNEVKYSSSSFGDDAQSGFSYNEQQTGEVENFGNKSLQYKHKSPMKAFLLSLAVPGLGQYYYGSKIKPIIFAGVEAVSWVMYFKFDGDGNDLTDDFIIFNDQHWSRDDYTAYLNAFWGVTSDTLINPGDITHHLPTTNTQQYYEMTGKYDQFAWGWDNATMSDFTLDDLLANPHNFSRIDPNNPESIPFSSNRFAYETMRNKANDKLAQAKNMSYVAMVNHLISAFEAFFTTRSHNEDLKKAKNEFAHWKIKASLKSSYTKYDTPYLNITFKL